MRRWVATLVLPLIVSLSLVGCGSKAASTVGSTTSPAAATGTSAAATCPSTPQGTLVKTRFATDIGLIIGTTKHFIYTPYQAGRFNKGASGRIVAIAKAGAAALAVYHLTGNAINNAKADPILCKSLIQPLTDLESALGAIKSKITGGDLSAVTDLNSSVDSLGSVAKSQGLSVVQGVIPGL